MSLKHLASAMKSIPTKPVWTEPSPADGYMRFSTPLEIDGITEAGLTFTGGAYYDHPQEHMSFELAVFARDGQRRIRLMRLDWKSLRGGHSNHRTKCGPRWSGKRVPETHFHSFDLNWSDAEQRMKKGKLPCAEPISEELQTFDDVRRFIRTSFRINNIELVPAPEWRYDLFYDR